MPNQEALSSKPKFYEKFGIVSLLTFVVACILLDVDRTLDQVTIPWLKALPNYDTAYLSILEFIAFIAKESGFAVLVAFFLNLSVEWINRRHHAEQEQSLVSLLDTKHQNRMNELLVELAKKYDERTTKLLKDVFQTVYERYIEKGVFKVIDDHVLKKNLMRKNYKVSMTISPIAEVTNIVNLEFNIQFDAVNLTQQEITLPVCGTMIDVTPEHEEKCKFVRARIGGRAYDEGELMAMVQRDSEKAQWSLKVTGTIPAHGSVPIELVYKKVGPRDYSEVICSVVQMDSMEIDVLLTDDSLDVNAVSLHPEDERRTSPADRKMFTSWKIDHAILPGQGAIVFWHPKRVKISSSLGPVPQGTIAPLQTLTETLPK